MVTYNSSTGLMVRICNCSLLHLSWRQTINKLVLSGACNSWHEQQYVYHLVHKCITSCAALQFCASVIQYTIFILHWVILFNVCMKDIAYWVWSLNTVYQFWFWKDPLKPILTGTVLKPHTGPQKVNIPEFYYCK